MKVYSAPISDSNHPSDYAGSIEVISGNKKYILDPLRSSNDPIQLHVKSNTSSDVNRFVMNTDRLQFVPVDASEETIDFCHKMFGKPALDYKEGTVMSKGDVAARVSELALQWTRGNFYSGFIVKDIETHESIGFTSLEPTRVKGEFAFEVFIVDTLADGSSIYNNKIGTEITAAMFQGWAVFLNDHLELHNAKTPEINFITAQVGTGNHAHRIFSHMLRESATNQSRSFTKDLRGSSGTRFYTTPEEMDALRKQILINEEFESTRRFAQSKDAYDALNRPMRFEDDAASFSAFSPPSPQRDDSFVQASPYRLPSFEQPSWLDLDADPSFHSEELDFDLSHLSLGDGRTEQKEKMD